MFNSWRWCLWWDSPAAVNWCTACCLLGVMFCSLFRFSQLGLGCCPLWGDSHTPTLDWCLFGTGSIERVTRSPNLYWITQHFILLSSVPHIDILIGSSLQKPTNVRLTRKVAEKQICIQLWMHQCWNIKMISKQNSSWNNIFNTYCIIRCTLPHKKTI